MDGHLMLGYDPRYMAELMFKSEANMVIVFPVNKLSMKYAQQEGKDDIEK